MTSATLAALGTGGAALIAALLTFFANRRSSTDTKAISLINAGQESLVKSLDRANVEIAAQGAALVASRAESRAELAAVREDLAVALRHHEECEEARMMLTVEVHDLKAQLRGTA